MTVVTTKVEVTTPDGVRSSAVFCARSVAPSWQSDERDALLVLPAMGVAAAYYQPFAEALAARGFPVMTAENRGTGSSGVRARKGVDFGYEEMLGIDLPAALTALRARVPGRTVHLVGHSLGGQLAALFRARHPDLGGRIILVASGSVHYRAYPFPSTLRVLVGTQTARAIARALGYYPGERLGFGGRQPRTVMRDWAHQGLTGAYRPRGARTDYEAALAQVEANVLAICIAGDRMCPVSATIHLTSKLRQARVERRTVDLAPTQRGNPHFRWARDPGPVVDAIEWYLGHG